MSDIEVMTVEEVAALLRIEPRTVYRKVEANEIPGAFRVGQDGAIRFVKEEILKWINGQIQKGLSSETIQP
ncbi:MAG: helix-turn-helix domain-containing protein [Candidatus Omnitrophica bacterium]|nr:helix-turn-helix domain-containing protein [Candidatus Omnitrophota bacterium]